MRPLCVVLVCACASSASSGLPSDVPGPAAVESLPPPPTPPVLPVRVDIAVEVRVDDGPWSRDAVAPLAGARLALRVAGLDVPDGATVRWYRVVPDVGTRHKNANFPWEPDPYAWIGEREPPSTRVEILDWAGQHTIEVGWDVAALAAVADLLPDDPPGYRERLRRYLRRGVGSFWFQVEVDAAGVTHRSPGPDEGYARALRVSLREGDDDVGWVTAFHGVPAVFGSAVAQSDGYRGVDCADVLVAAHAHARGGHVTRNERVASLTASLARVADSRLVEGRAEPPVSWSTIRRGDLIAVRYDGASEPQHIGILVGDDGDGVLDGDDEVLHAGPWPLQREALAGGSFDGRVSVLRWRE